MQEIGGTPVSKGSISPLTVPWLLSAPHIDVDKKWYAPPMSKHLHLPLRTLTVETPRPTRACAAQTTPTKGRNLAAELVNKFQIGVQDMMLVYMSPDPYHDAFDQTVDLWNFDPIKHATGGLSLYVRDDRVHLAPIAPGTPAARTHSWRTRIRGAWLIKVGNFIVESIEDVVRAFHGLRTSGSPSVTLLFSHPEVRPNLSQAGLPIVSSALFTQHTHDQLNNQWEFSMVAAHLRTCRPLYEHMHSGDVLNVVTRVMRLTRG